MIETRPEMNRAELGGTGPDGQLEQSLCGQAALRVDEDSMEPDLRKGQVVGISFGRVFLPGDVVVFRDRQEGVLHAHRLVGYRRWHGKWAAIASADNASSLDAPVPLEEVVGRVSYADLTISVMDRVRAAGVFLRELYRTVRASLERRP